MTPFFIYTYQECYRKSQIRKIRSISPVFEPTISRGGGRLPLGIGELVIIRPVGLGLSEGRGLCGLVSIGPVLDNIPSEDIVRNGVLPDIIGNGELRGIPSEDIVRNGVLPDIIGRGELREITSEDLGGNVGLPENMGNGELRDIPSVLIGGRLKSVEFLNDENMSCGCAQS